LYTKYEEVFMNGNMDELKSIVTKFAGSCWDLIADPANAWLAGEGCKEKFIEAVEKADAECGSCGCEMDPLYKKFLEMKEFV
jgi:hypothetical protein